MDLRSYSNEHQPDEQVVVETWERGWCQATNPLEKILKKETLTQTTAKRGVSHFWSALMKIETLFYSFYRRIVRSVHQTRFWEDLWVG